MLLPNLIFERKLAQLAVVQVESLDNLEGTIYKSVDRRCNKSMLHGGSCSTGRKSEERICYPRACPARGTWQRDIALGGLQPMRVPSLLRSSESGGYQ